jgi:hypothetical protein
MAEDSLAHDAAYQHLKCLASSPNDTYPTITSETPVDRIALTIVRQNPACMTDIAASRASEYHVARHFAVVIQSAPSM